MQNTNQTQREPRIGRAVGWILAFIALVALMCIATPAYAKSYTMPQVDIKAEAMPDGSLNVSEQRVFNFSGSFSAVWWTFSGLPSKAELKVNGVTLTRVDKNNAAIGDPVYLSEVPFVLSWRDSGGPSGGAYSLDSPKNTLYAFFSASDERVLVNFDYTVVNGVQAYKDVGEVCWKFIGSQWAEASDEVTMTMILPVPQGASVTPGDNVRAWGHGPLDGSVTFNADGSITYKESQVNAGQYAEARVVFPVAWLTGLSKESAELNKDQLRLETVLKEEQTWADQANRTRTQSLLFVIACGVISALLLVWAIRSYWKHGKEYVPDFTDEYWRDVPSPTDHPAVMARLWRWNKESNDDFSATLMHLSSLGAIRINKGSYEKPAVFGTKTVDDYYITRVPEKAKLLKNPIDIQAMNLLFKKIADNSGSLWFASIEKYGKDDPEGFVSYMQQWQGCVSAETNKRDFFELKGQRLQLGMVSVAAVFAFFGIAFSAYIQNFIPLIFIIPTALVMLIISKYMPRRSREGNTLDAKCKALRNWLKDFSALNERPPTDVKVWGELMVYAYLFGVAKQVMKALELKVPELFQDETVHSGVSSVPWWFWYGSSYGSGGNIMPSIGDMLSASVSNTMHTAQAAISAASGGSSGGGFSDGGGGGGGFSGGDAGGFDGGGGAR